MSVVTALEALAGIVLLLNVAATVLIVRRLRDLRLNPLPRSEVRPAKGFIVDLGRDRLPWPAEAAAMMSGAVLVAFVIPGCRWCEDLRRDIASLGRLPLPLYVVLDSIVAASERGATYLEDEWAIATAGVVSPQQIDALASFDKPSSLPTVLLLNNGEVLASGNRWSEIASDVLRATHGMALS